MNSLLKPIADIFDQPAPDKLRFLICFCIEISDDRGVKVKSGRIFKVETTMYNPPGSHIISLPLSTNHLTHNRQSHKLFFLYL